MVHDTHTRRRIQLIYSYVFVFYISVTHDMQMIRTVTTNHKSFAGFLSGFQHITDSFWCVRIAVFRQLQVITDFSVFAHHWEEAVLRQIHHLHMSTCPVHNIFSLATHWRGKWTGRATVISTGISWLVHFVSLIIFTWESSYSLCVGSFFFSHFLVLQLQIRKFNYEIFIQCC